MIKMTNNKTTTALIWICRIAVGLLFIFSGLVKANDPLGFSYKLEEYFEVFHITFFNNYSVFIAITLCAFEMILGFALLIGYSSVRVAWGLLLLIIFFAFLTFYSAYFKVVQTCGCFGDAIPLTPWQSFSKDLVLLLLILVLFVYRKQINPLFAKKTGSRMFLGAIIVSFGVGFMTYNFGPVIDFLPYKVGANIPDEMKIPPGAVPDEYELTYKLENKATHEKKTMTNTAYLKSGIWKDNNWEVKGDPESRLVKKGFTPKIPYLQIQDAQKNDYLNELMDNPFYSLVIVAYDLKHTNVNAIGRINALAANLHQDYNTRVVLLTATTPEDAEAFAKANHLVTELFYVDEVPLKSMVRSNPGVLLMQKGTIVDKWHYHMVPSYDVLIKKYFRK